MQIPFEEEEEEMECDNPISESLQQISISQDSSAMTLLEPMKSDEAPLFKEKIEKIRDFLLSKQYCFTEIRIRSASQNQDEQSIKEQSILEAENIIDEMTSALFDPKKFQEYFFQNFEPIRQDIRFNYFLKPSAKSLEDYITEEMAKVNQRALVDELTTRVLVLNPDFYKAPWFTNDLPFFNDFKNTHGSHPHLGFQIGTYIMEWNSQEVLIPKLLNSRNALGIFYLFDSQGKPKNIKKEDIPKVCILFYFFHNILTKKKINLQRSSLILSRSGMLK